MSSLPGHVLLLAIGNVGLEAQALRALFEQFNVHVSFRPVGRANDIVIALADTQPAESWLVLSCHGGDTSGAIALEPLAAEIAAEEPFVDELTAADVRAHARLSGQVVWSTGCETGDPEMADAFLGAGARAYVAPAGSPFGYTPIVFLANLLYALKNGQQLEKAVAWAGRDSELAMFRYFSQLGESR